MNDTVNSALSALSEGRRHLFDLAERLRASPELGFFEVKTAAMLAAELEGMGARVERGLALTGLRAEVGPPGAPAIALLADMDALPTQGAPGGTAHSCGHHAQMAILAAVFKALVAVYLPGREKIRLLFIASPAEEYVDLGRRMELRESGTIRYLSGKQEMIRLGVFDDVSVVLKYHSMADSPVRKATVNGTLNGFMAKRAEFIGKAAHAGAHPEDGVNALNAASLALQAIHAQRETFVDSDHVRVHPILSEGGTVVNSVPARAVLETYIRAATHEAIMDAAIKVDRALCAGALAVGASLRIRSTPGYQAFHPSPAMGNLLGEAAKTLLPASAIDFEDASYASDDIGDVACLLPTCQLGYSGFCGTIHNADFAPTDSERAYFEPAAILLRLTCTLAENGGAKAASIRKEFQPHFSKTDYLASLDAQFSERFFDGSTAGFKTL
ncbi:MAG: amidohydrolase [Spirochaetae bacterium HGW-Spirochaetae-9]|nr:MAG: amidohydrolase [Spirochaetae bacterium HGW-Spirochaetae-9]